MQLVEPVRDVRVVVEVRGKPGAPVAHRPPERLHRKQLSELDGRPEHVVAVEAAGPLGECGEGEPIP